MHKTKFQRILTSEYHDHYLQFTLLSIHLFDDAVETTERSISHLYTLTHLIRHLCSLLDLRLLDSAVVIGIDRVHQLRAGRMTSPDIRAGIALLIAALSAKGESRIDNIAQIDRGYENIEARLNALGAKITRVEN